VETKSRRRGAELEHAILEAAWAELNEVGYPALTIEAVAKRAGTSKPVIYRRWPNRAALVMSAWALQQPIKATTPDLGSLRADIRWLFARIATRMGTMMSQAIAGVMAEAFKHPEIQALLRERMDSVPLANVVQTVVERAVERGELPKAVLPQRVLRLPVDLLRAEAIMYGNPIPEETLDALVDEVYLPLLKGLAHE
jgi:AcrR family transcriptional regulator